jgi:hypothetical protein
MLLPSGLLLLSCPRPGRLNPDFHFSGHLLSAAFIVVGICQLHVESTHVRPFRGLADPPSTGPTVRCLSD